MKNDNKLYLALAIVASIGVALTIISIPVSQEREATKQADPEYQRYEELRNQYRLNCDEGMHTGNECLIIGMLDEILKELKERNK